MDLKTGDAKVSPVLFWARACRAYQRRLAMAAFSLLGAGLADAVLLTEACAGRTALVLLCFDFVPVDAISLMTRKRWPAIIFGFIPTFHPFNSCALTA
jgi:hypothetical protein